MTLVLIQGDKIGGTSVFHRLRKTWQGFHAMTADTRWVGGTVAPGSYQIV
jgi:hypothetical protein